MKRASFWAVALCAVSALTGCIDTATKIIVKTDGSGTIEKTIVLSKNLVDFVEGMGADGNAASIEASMLSEKSLKAEAARMGGDVAFVSAQKLTTAKGNGYKAVYSFKDITKVRLDQNPAADVTMPAGGAASGSQSSPPELLTFKFVKGSPAALTIIAPKVEPQPAARAAQSQASPEDAQKMMEAMRPLYSDLRIALSIEVQGTISETNAAYVDGSTVTLMDMDFGKILADEAMFKKLAATQAQSIKQIQELVKTVPGLKLDTQESITIKFR